MELEELLLKAKDGDKNAEEKIVKNNVRLVWSIVKRIHTGVSEEDLFQIGCIGLVKAIRKFDIKQNVKFSTYAFPLILGEIKMYLREDGMIKMSRSVKDHVRKIAEVKERYLLKHNRDITICEIAIELNIDKDEVIIALNSQINISSIEKMSEEGPAYGELRDQEDVEENVLNRLMFIEVLKKLEPIERKVILLRYLKEEKQDEIGRKYKMSQVKVSRIEKEALSKIKKILLI